MVDVSLASSIFFFGSDREVLTTFITKVVVLMVASPLSFGISVFVRKDSTLFATFTLK